MSATVFLGTPSLRSPPRKRGPSPFRQRVWPWVPACAGTNGDGNGNGLRDGSSDRQKFFPPLPADRLAAEQRELVERPGDRLAGRLDRGHRVAMGAAALNRAGIATLEIDQWGGRGLPGGASSRPRNLTDNLPDVAGAYRLLAARSDINADSIGLMGSSMRRC